MLLSKDQTINDARPLVSAMLTTQWDAFSKTSLTIRLNNLLPNDVIQNDQRNLAKCHGTWMVKMDASEYQDCHVISD